MIYLLSLILFLLPSYLIRFQILGVPTNLLDVLIILAVVGGLISSLQGTGYRLQVKNQLPETSTLIPILFFLLAGLISVFVSPDRLSALGYLKSWIILPILFGWTLKNVLNTEDDLSREKRGKILIYGLLGGGLWVSLHAIYQRIIGQVSVDGRVLGIYGLFPAENASPNYLSLYLTPIGAIVLALIAIKLKNIKTEWPKSFLAILPLGLSALMFILAIFFSSSRGGFLGVVAALLIIIYYLLLSRLPQFKKQLKIGVILLAILGFLIVGYWARPDLSASPDSGRVATSNNIRYEIWKTSFQMIAKNPILGIGLGNFQNYFTEFTKERVNYPEFISPQAYSPHNLFLAFWLNLGLLGLIAFVWLLVIFFKNLRSLDYFSAEYLILSTALLAILVHGLVDTPYFKNDLAVIFWIIFYGFYLLPAARKGDFR